MKKPLLLLYICTSLLELLANFSIKKIAFSAFVLLFSSISYADAICRDGWWSKSEGSGTCSWHGGVKRWLADGTITLWQFLIILGIALVIFIINIKKSSKSNSHISTKKNIQEKGKECFN